MSNVSMSNKIYAGLLLACLIAVGVLVLISSSSRPPQEVDPAHITVVDVAQLQEGTPESCYYSFIQSLNSREYAKTYALLTKHSQEGLSQMLAPKFTLAIPTQAQDNAQPVEIDVPTALAEGKRPEVIAFWEYLAEEFQTASLENLPLEINNQDASVVLVASKGSNNPLSIPIVKDSGEWRIGLIEAAEQSTSNNAEAGQ